MPREDLQGTNKRPHVWRGPLFAMVLFLCLQVNALASPSPGNWSVGVGLVLSGFPGVAVNLAWNASERVSILGGTTLGFVLDEGKPITWWQAGLRYEAPISGTFTSTTFLGFSQMRVDATPPFKDSLTMLEFDVGGSKRLSETVDFAGEVRLAHLLNQESWAPLLPVGLQFGMRYYPQVRPR